MSQDTKEYKVLRPGLYLKKGEESLVGSKVLLTDRQANVNFVNKVELWPVEPVEANKVESTSTEEDSTENIETANSESDFELTEEEKARLAEMDKE